MHRLAFVVSSTALAVFVAMSGCGSSDDSSGSGNNGTGGAANGGTGTGFGGSDTNGSGAFNSSGGSGNGPSNNSGGSDAGTGGDGLSAGGSSGGGSGNGPSNSSGSAEGKLFQPLPPPPEKPELWYWHHTYSSAGNGKEPAYSQGLIDKAVAAGYTGLALWDSGLTFLNRPGWDSSKLKQIVAYAVSKGLKILPSTAPYGYSNDMLQTDPNLAEGQHVVGSQFKVSSGKLVLVNSLKPVDNGSFEGGSTGWFSFGDAGVSVSTSVAHGGSASALLAPSSGNNQRLTQSLTLTPWRLYHLRFWLKSSGLSGGMTVRALDATDANNPIDRVNHDLSVPSNQDWTQYDLTFNSRESTKVLLYIGIWGGHQGNLWIDDIVAEETALVNLLRRKGTPVKVYNPASGATYTEGTDVSMIEDPGVKASNGNFDLYHTPPVISVPAGSKLTAGQTVAIDSYSVFPSIAGGVGVCLTEDAVHGWMQNNIAAIDGIFPKQSGFFLGYDEMRHMHSCDLCRQKAPSAGQLLAWNVGRSVDEVNAVRPNASLYVWSDMFDPYHNAVNNYYSVEGDIAGSWEGLPPGVVVMNWNLGTLQKSLTWFAGKDPSGKQQHGFQQIIAGYYSSPDGGSQAAAKELGAAAGIPGVIGSMFTVWNDDYSQLQQYADGVRGAWNTYRKSVLTK